MPDAFCTTSGVRQGCIGLLVPILFCCATDWLMRQCFGSFRIDVVSIHLTNINYTDDAVLFTHDATKWDDVLHNFKASASVMGLHTN